MVLEIETEVVECSTSFGRGLCQYFNIDANSNKYVVFEQKAASVKILKLLRNIHIYFADFNGEYTS